MLQVPQIKKIYRASSWWLRHYKTPQTFKCSFAAAFKSVFLRPSDNGCPRPHLPKGTRAKSRDSEQQPPGAVSTELLWCQVSLGSSRITERKKPPARVYSPESVGHRHSCFTTQTAQLRPSLEGFLAWFFLSVCFVVVLSFGGFF